MFNYLAHVLRVVLVDNWAITLAAVLGFAAIYLLLPRPRATPWTWGILAAGLALLVAGAFVVRAGASPPKRCSSTPSQPSRSWPAACW